jgi:hypothetical protein
LIPLEIQRSGGLLRIRGCPCSPICTAHFLP